MSKPNPAVSQLAGEIADRIRALFNGDISHGKSTAEIISAALSEREEKVANLIAAVGKLLLAYGGTPISPEGAHEMLFSKMEIWRDVYFSHKALGE
jgi:hypothetical protein